MKLFKFFFLLLSYFSVVQNIWCDEFIERVLNIELQKTNAVISQEVFEIRKQAFKKVEEGNYKESLEIIVLGVEKFSQDFLLQVNFATLIGDYSGNFSNLLKERMIKRSQEIFEKLLCELEGQPKSSLYYFKNEYYYRFAMHKEQYEVGLERIANYWGTQEWDSRGISGYYCQGVGAANYAKKLLLQGDSQLAHDYAQKALVAWAQYFSYHNSYYNAYVHYAMALGILGFKDEALKALTHAADLIESDLNFHEFKEVIEFLILK